jgi:hypothetical protein
MYIKSIGYQSDSQAVYGMRAAISLPGTRHHTLHTHRKGGDFTMRTILAAMFAVMIGLTFVGSTFADDKKMDAPAGAPSTSTDTTKTETKTENKTENKNGKKSKKHKKTTKTEEKSTSKP